VCECDRETSIMRRPWPTAEGGGGTVGLWGKYNIFKILKCGAGE
jgi:hypothetical protein